MKINPEKQYIWEDGYDSYTMSGSDILQILKEWLIQK